VFRIIEKPHEPGSYSGIETSSTRHAVNSRRVKVLLPSPDGSGSLVPCDCQFTTVVDDHFGVGQLCEYVVAGTQIDRSDLVELDTMEYRNDRSEESGTHQFIAGFLDTTLGQVQFLRYDGFEEQQEPQEPSRFLWMRFKRPSKTVYSHRFTACRLRSPLDEEFEQGITDAINARIERIAEIARLADKAIAIEAAHYCVMNGLEDREVYFDDISHVEEQTGDMSIESVRNAAIYALAVKTRLGTMDLVALSCLPQEIPGGLLRPRKVIVTCSAIAIVLRK
jgi:hypothetical protein